MSEPIPESIPTSADPRSKRPTKKRALSPTSKQASEVEALFAKPDRDIQIPDSSTGKKSHLPPPPEIVSNVQGSSAGAGSGEFHVYKASRRREYERIRSMEEEVKREKENEEFLKAREEQQRRDAAKTSKNKKRREKAKQRQQKKKDGSRDSATPGPDTIEPGTKRAADGKLKPNPLANGALKDTTDGAEQEGQVEEIGIIIHDED